MDSDRWRRLNELFTAALERDPQERTAFLAEACAGDAGLLEDVARLVRAHEEAEGGLLDGSAFTAGVRVLTRAADESTLVGQRLGTYRLISALGRGGMGAVYLAERADAQYEKRVAIKLIKRGMDTEAVLRQFRHERQILASLEHLNIARLLDGGTTDDGLPYFVMEHIAGQPIHEYCDTHRLSVTARLHLFRDVCSAVSYAHQHLVVHRDIKPSNILVTQDGVVKLLDFGIAKIMLAGEATETRSTVAALRLMTPEYASPEQVQGLPATTLSDVYSLGAVLYELLTGRTPHRFTSRSSDAIAHTIVTADPARPSDAVARTDRSDRPLAESSLAERVNEGSAERLRRRLRGDLDTIVLKALHKERDRRYQSVEQLSEDIWRHLAGLPVLAQADTLVYRGAKFVGRHKGAVAAGVLAGVTLLGGVLATAWQARRATLQEGIAKAEQARAERRFNDVRKLARSVLFDYHDAIKDLPGATPVRARLVRDALEYLNSLASEANDDPSLLHELASAYERVGDVQGGTMFANLGDTPGAIDSYRKATALREALMAAEPHRTDTRRDAALGYRKLGLLLWETGDMNGATRTVRQALSLLESVTAEDESATDVAFEIAHTHDYVGMIQQEQGNASGALESYRRAREAFEAASVLDPASQKIRRGQSVSLEHIGTALLLTSDLEGALAHNRQALALRAALVAESPLNADYRRALAVGYYNDGEILAKMGRLSEALESYRKDLTIADELSARDPQNEQYRGDVAYALIRVGDMLVALGQTAPALASYQRSLALRAIDVTADPANLWKRSSLIEAKAKLAKAFAKVGQQPAALKGAADTVSLMEATTVEPSNAHILSFFADTYVDLAEVHAAIASARGTRRRQQQAQWRAARDLYQRSADIWTDLRDRGIVSRIDLPKLDAMRREVARCNQRLAILSRR